jgi:hypothetical protein
MARNDLTEQVLFLLGCESELADQHFSIPEVNSQLLIRKNSKKDWLTGGLPLPLPPPRLPRFLPRGITFHLMYLLQYLKRFRLNIGIWGHTKVVFRHLFKESLYNIHLVCSLYFVVAVYHYKLPRLKTFVLLLVGSKQTKISKYYQSIEDNNRSSNFFFFKKPKFPSQNRVVIF